ncbi:hypothetical protein JTE90_014984 [Oedothorax gibbosus]|uniref:ABC transporter domain-containing protein n=1 Tax=Oedothorax gibbosus TaxID=931172 RepID=A0AAV6UWU8_9ARAC|nr:hypothetical protein JTE90_014984 [Oedothorax gibbosus]
MEVVRQVKWLLWRNAVLRIRQPVILALEMLWPVAIFLVVMAARNTIPPAPQPTCHYRAFALPSAGVVPFVQSLICNIDECQNGTEYEDTPTYKGSSVRELVSHALPLLSSPDISALVSALPAGARLMRAAADALAAPDIAALLGDGFPVRRLLLDAPETRATLLTIGMTGDEVDSLLDSSLQLPQILELGGGSTCDAPVSDPPGDAFETFRSRLCTEDAAARAQLYAQLRGQLDVKNIVQTMGLAMSGLGRRDVGSLLGALGGLLSAVQSSPLHGDTLQMAATLLRELRRIDPTLISLVVRDLEPLYEDSPWAPLVHALAEIRFQDSRTIDNRTSEPSESEADSGDTPAKENALRTFLDVVETGLDVVHILPENTTRPLHTSLKYISVLIDLAQEVKESLGKDDSSTFLDTLGAALGSLFLAIAHENDATDTLNELCDEKEFQKVFHATEWQHNPVLSHHVCRMAKMSGKGPSHEAWSSSLKKLRRVLSKEGNLPHWEAENHDDKPFYRTTVDEGNIDDVISTFDCITQEIQDIFKMPASLEKNDSSSGYFTAKFGHKIDKPRDRLALLGLSGAKELALRLLASSSKGTGAWLSGLRGLAGSAGNSSSATAGLSSSMLAFLQDAESATWRSMTPKLVEELHGAEAGHRPFCVEAGALEASQLHWRRMLCEENSTLHKIPLHQGWKTEDTSRRLLALVGAAARMLEPLEGACWGGCRAGAPSALRRMCFLGRVHAAREILGANDTRHALQGALPDRLVEALSSYEALMDILSGAPNNTNWKDIARLSVSVVRQAEIGDQGKRVLNALLSLLKNRLADAHAQDGVTVGVSDLFPDSPLTQEVVESLLPLLPEVTTTALWTALANGRMAQLVSASGRNVSVVMSALCGAPLSARLFNPALDNEQWAALGAALCRHRYYDVFEEIFQDPDIQEIVFESGDPVSWSDVEENLLEGGSLLQGLMLRPGASSSALLPLAAAWAAAAQGARAHLSRPWVLLHAAAAHLFAPFCEAPSSALCTLASPGAARRVAEAVEEGRALAAIPELRAVAEEVLGWDPAAPQPTSGGNMTERIVNATRRVFELVDGATEAKLSVVILNSSIPEVLRDLALHMGGVENAQNLLASDGVLKAMLQQDYEKQRMENQGAGAGRRKAIFVESVAKLAGVSLRVSGASPFDLARWAARNMQRTHLQDSSCLTASAEGAVRESARKMAHSIRVSGELSCQLLNKNVSDFYAWFSDSSDLKTALAKVANGSGESCLPPWEWMNPVVDSVELLYEQLHLLSNCTQPSLLLSSLNAHAKVLQQMARVLSSVGAPPLGEWRDEKERIYEKISRHLPVFLKVSEVVPLGQEEKFLEDVTINWSWLVHQGFSAEAFRGKMCVGDLSLPATSFLCLRNGTEALLGRMNRTHITQKVSGVQRDAFFSGAWLRRLLGSSTRLVDLASRLLSALEDVRTPLDALRIVAEPGVVADSFSELVRVVEPVFADSELADTLLQISSGLDALRSLARIAAIDFTYKLGDVFESEEDALTVLQEELGLAPEAARSVLDTRIDISKAPGNLEGAGSVLFSHSRTRPSPERMHDLLLRRVLASLGSLGAEGVLHSAGLGAGEAGRALAALSSAPAVLGDLQRHLAAVTRTLPPEVGALLEGATRDPAWIKSREALSFGGRVLCGRPLGALSRRFQLLAPPEAPYNPPDPKEMLRLPTEFCRHGYEEILRMRGGAILWGFLKPIFRGKILYAPKNSATARLVVAKVNASFSALSEQVRWVRAAARGSTGLHYLQRRGELLHALQRVLSSRAVSRLVGDASLGSALSWLEEESRGGRGGGLLRLVELVGNVTECVSLDRFLGFDTEEELEAAAATLHHRREFIAALVFLDKDEEGGLPSEVRYKIRMDIDNVPTTEHIKYRWWRPYPYDDFFEDLRYFRGFLQLQDAVDNAILQLHANSSTEPSHQKYLQQFPYPCHQRDKFGTLLKGSMPAVMTLSWVFVVAFLVRERVLDKETHLEETLCVMGVRRVSARAAWFLSGAAVLLCSVGGIVAVLKWGGVTPHSDPALLFLFVADFALLLIAYCHLVSGFFSRASTGALISVLLYVLSFFPFLLFVTWDLDFHYWHKLASCCLVSTSFCFGCLYLNRFEDQGEGVRWENLWSSPVHGDRMNFGTALCAMLFCALLYAALAALLEAARGFHGRKPLLWYALFKPAAKMNESLSSVEFQKLSRDLKEPIKDRPAKDGAEEGGIVLDDVHALYRGGRGKWRALSGLTLRMREGCITSLLGHNGAGKTTTIKILTGRLRPTSGCVSVCGLSLPAHTRAVRRMLGFCPQGNTLYDKLTVQEHLNLFASLKGLLDKRSLEKDVEEMVVRLGLEEKRGELCGTLSGGQRRRLCVGAAFVGGSRVVILDEPTSSVDPVARRAIWDIILAHKTGRTILFTTHHLDEADILSDRVAILHRGRVLCCGSPLELKSRFGSGYRLSLVARPGNTVDDEGAAAVMRVVRGHSPDAALLEWGREVVVSLPTDPPLAAAPLSALFAHLERRLAALGFSAISVSSPTLEEVFLTLCRLEDAKSAHDSLDVSPFRDAQHKAEKPDAEEEPAEGAVRGWRLRGLQLKSLVLARWWRVVCDWRALCSGVLLPCLFIALAMGLAAGRPDPPPDPPLELSSALYSAPHGGGEGVAFFRFDNPKSDLGRQLLNVMGANGSLSQTCLEDDPKCSGIPTERCLCESECDGEAGASRPSSFVPAPRLVLQNMSGVPLPAHLLRSYLQFNEKRYGGWTVSENSSKVWFENSGYHAAPSFLSALDNALLQRHAPPGRRLGIRTWSHPLRLSIEQLGRETLFQRLGEVGISFVFLIGLSLVPCTFAAGVVRERDEKRVARVVLGGGAVVWWAGRALCDAALLALSCALCAAVVAAFRLPAFCDRDNFVAVVAIMAAYGFATTPLSYVCSRLFNEGSLAFMVLFTSHLFAGLVIMLALVSLRMLAITKDVAWALEWMRRLSLVLPQYGLVGGLTDLHENQIRAELFAQFGQDAYSPPLSLLAPHLLAMLVQGIALLALNLGLECDLFSRWRRKPPTPEAVDGKESLLQIKNVSQIYKTRAGRKYAVDELSLDILPGECFGLVGANGAGKTTLFRMLIGEARPTRGTINAHGSVGYCPQKDALDPLLTPTQHLRVYAGLRGISPAHKVVERCLRSFELESHARVPAGALSGGTQRKLCTAIATLGDPRIVLLDEPTSGMDPATRRLVWRCITRATHQGRAVVLTSHSIEDCDALCSRLGIMVNGKLACTDHTARLKHRLGRGYTLSLSMPEGREGECDEMLRRMRTHMPAARVTLRSGRRVEVSLPDESVPLSRLFAHLEECARLFGTDDIALHPTTLDQVFVNFVRQQTDSLRPEPQQRVPKGDPEMCSTKL